jgi:flagellar motor switch protein FliN/FliY
MNKKTELNPISKIPCTVSVEIGSAILTFDELTKMSNETTYELNRLAGDFMIVKINGIAVAEAEVIVVNERYGIRIKKVYNPNGDENE